MSSGQGSRATTRRRRRRSRSSSRGGAARSCRAATAARRPSSIRTRSTSSAAQGAHIWDADGIERVDFNGNYTSLILGHATPDVVKAVQDGGRVAGCRSRARPSTRSGWPRSSPAGCPSVESLRFTNSGTEATMNAVRLARAFTGRPKIAKFEGAFHGTHDWVHGERDAATPSRAGNRASRPKPVAWSAGVPPAVLKHVVVLPWNDAEACEEILEQGRRRPSPRSSSIRHARNGGLIPPVDGFLARLREVTERLGILLIFDEVISFRIGVGRRPGALRHPARPHHARQDHRRRPAGGRLRRPRATSWTSTIRARAAPRISQGGTFNANPVTMAAGVATLNALTPEAYARLDALGERLRGGVSAAPRGHAAARAR